MMRAFIPSGTSSTMAITSRCTADASGQNGPVVTEAQVGDVVVPEALCALLEGRQHRAVWRNQVGKMQRFEADDRYNFAILDADDTFCGYGVAFSVDRKDLEAELGYAVSPWARGRFSRGSLPPPLPLLPRRGRRQASCRLRLPPPQASLRQRRPCPPQARRP